VVPQAIRLGIHVKEDPMPYPRRTRVAFAVMGASVGLLAAGCGFDSSSGATQNRECRDATVGHTNRDAVHAALGDPTITDHETLAGRPVVSDLWVDGTVGFSFDEQTHVLVEKDCED
jgi:hypothetical protein